MSSTRMRLFGENTFAIFITSCPPTVLSTFFLANTKPLSTRLAHVFLRHRDFQLLCMRYSPAKNNPTETMLPRIDYEWQPKLSDEMSPRLCSVATLFHLKSIMLMHRMMLKIVLLPTALLTNTHNTCTFIIYGRNGRKLSHFFFIQFLSLSHTHSLSHYWHTHSSRRSSGFRCM